MDAIAKTRFDKSVIAKLKAVASSINKISTWVAVILNNDGMEIREISPAHTALYQVLIGLDDFYEHEVKGEVLFGLNLEEFLKVLKQVKKEDALYMNIYPAPTEDEPDRQIIELVVKNERREKRYNLLDKTTKEERHNKWVKVPELPLKRGVKMNTKELFNAIKEISGISDDFIITVTKNLPHLVIENGSDIEDTGEHIQMTFTVESLCNDEIDVEAKSTFPVDEVLSIKPLPNVYKEVEVLVGTDLPLELIFKDEHDKVLYMVAPRIYD